MSKIKFSYPNGKMKAVTLSYDDGVEQDFRLVKILNENNIKCTFNLNSQVPAGYNWTCNGKDIFRINLKENINLYEGHEVAIHTCTHPKLIELSKEEVIREVYDDKIELQNIYNRKIEGMAYPFGDYNDEVIETLKELGVKYSRTIEDTERFGFPKEYLAWHPTCRHRSENLMDLAKEFIESNDEEMKLFYLWGHSYEFDVDNNWDIIEKFCHYIKNRDEIWYATNIEIYDYMKALELVEIDEESKFIINKCDKKVWLYVDEELKSINSGEILKVK